MPQFLDRDYFGYRVCLRPTDLFRNYIRIKIPHRVDLFLIPYLWGTDISFNLIIKATKLATPTALAYEWQLYTDEKKQPDKTGNGVADMTIKRKDKATLDLGHFSHTHKYHLNMKIKTMENESEYYTVADFETSSRTHFQLLILAALFTVIGGVIGGLVVHFLGG